MSEERGTWLPFSRAEQQEIRTALSQSVEPPPCPVCGKPLKMSGPRRNAFDIRCQPCRRHTILPEELVDRPV